MAKLGSALLEVVRMMIWMMIFTTILANIETAVLQSWITWQAHYTLYLFFGNLLWFLVLYRNRLQFRGWYRSEATQRKLSRGVTAAAIGLGAVLVMMPAIISLAVA